LLDEDFDKVQKNTSIKVKVKLYLHILYFRNITPVFGEVLTNQG